MGIWKDKRRNTWSFSFQYLGEIYAGGGHKTKSEAAAARAQKRKEVKEPPKQPGMTLQAATISYLVQAERKFAEQTYKYKQFVYEKFLHHIGEIEMAQITPQHVESYLLKLPSNNNYNVHRKELSAFFVYAKKNLKIPMDNPCEVLTKMPHTPKQKITPTEDEMLRIIQAADPATDERDLIITVIQTLARIDEVLRMKWSDVNFERETVVLWTRKHKEATWRPDILPMNKDLRAVLERRFAARTQQEWVFFNDDEKIMTRFNHRPKLMNRLCKLAGCDPIGERHVRMTPKNIRAFTKKNGRAPSEKEIDQILPQYYGFHHIRHFMGSYIVDRNKESMKDAQFALRHQAAATTEIYVHSISRSHRATFEALEGKFGGHDDNEGQEAGFDSQSGGPRLGQDN